MKYRLLNYVACPYCREKGFPLKLIVFDVEKYENRKIPNSVTKPLCDIYCSYKNMFVKDLSEYLCDECIKFEVKTGILYCTTCRRWYPIVDEIPRILPDEYRKKNEDLEFLKRYSDRLPDEIKNEGKPYNLVS